MMQLIIVFLMHVGALQTFNVHFLSHRAFEINWKQTRELIPRLLWLIEEELL